MKHLEAARLESARQGFHVSGTVPYGYMPVCKSHMRVRLVPHPAESLVVKEIFSSYLRLKSIAKVIAKLSVQTTRSGKLWSRAGIAWILKNRTYVGRTVYCGMNIVAEHPRIVANIIFYKAGKLIVKNNRRKK